MMIQSRRSPAFATTTASKMRDYSNAADQGYDHKYPKPNAYAPVYISLGLLLISVSIGAFTATHQLNRSPNVSLKNSMRETLPELVEPEKVAEESEDFINKSFFRKIAHVQDADR
ncbi:hypothetical protein L1987_52541 [Smallanthus sonchifolius]|uniref:Uncharacterized protein n=1 Tax=Smallanthus sonchifolius TaxID=185202 RepID=A0ACB9EU16_9ASTR|nr:hypothetical protein L1987_52541 [Smallanthus sonchifolius]